MKRILSPIALGIILSAFIYSCSSDDDDSTPPSVIQTPTPEPEETTTQFTLTVSAGEGGNVSSEGGTYDEGTKVTLTATPNEGFVLSNWSNNSTENPITLTINSNLSLTALFEEEKINFTNRSPVYPSVNNTVGNIKTNYYHPGRVLTPDIIENFIDLRENCDCTGCSCRVSYNLCNNSSRYIDYNNDGLIDLFGWLINNSDGYAVGYGKYVLVDDIFNNPKTTYFDSNVWFGARMEINDFNGDGVNDILVHNQNDHSDLEGGHYTDKIPMEIIYISQNGTINISPIGDPTSGHEFTSFDIDNDNDVDIVNFEWWMGHDPQNSHVEVPLFYINDGSGNFNVTNTQFKEHYFYKTTGLDCSFTAGDSFDLDNDGYVDLLIAGESESAIQYCIYDNPNDQFEQNCYESDYLEGIRVLWGSESSTFSEENSTRIPLSLFDNGNQKLGYSFGFIDINFDGNYEILSVGTNIPVNSLYGPNSGGYIEIYNNNGDRTFTNITHNSMDVSEWSYKNKRSVDTGDIPLFYDLAIVDVDNDGDFDIMPHTINDGSVILKDTDAAGVDSFKYQTNIGSNFHWRNDGGFFTLSDDKKDYEN